MPTLVIDAMDDATRWSGFAADGTTPSTSFTLVDETVQVRFGSDHKSGRITATAGALSHTLRRSMAAANLSAFDELRMWVRGDRLAGEPETRPFYLELRLASAALPLSNPANQWHRYFPLAQPNAWELVRFSIADLPAGIRNAVTQLQLRCINATTPFTLFIDDVLAVREEMIADVEAGLLARLHNRITVGATTIPAAVYAADVKASTLPSTPYIRVMPYDVRYSDARLTPAEVHTDFSSTGYLLRPPATPYELFYQVAVFGEPRSTQTRCFEFILKELGGQGQLLVNNVPVPMQSVIVDPIDLVGGARDERVAMHYRISTRQEMGNPRPVRPVTTLVLETDHQQRGLS